MNTTTINEANHKGTKSKSLSYRYGNPSRQTSLCVPEPLLEALSEKKGGRKQAEDFCKAMAKEFSASGYDRVSRRVQHLIYNEIINKNLLIMYKPSIEDVAVSCYIRGSNADNGGRCQAPVLIPSIVMSALSSRYSDAKKEIRNAYDCIKPHYADDRTRANVSNLVRFQLLQLIR